MVVVAIDEVDCKLLQALQRDCKASLSELGKEVDLSAPSVMDRIRKLEAAGVIKGYHAAIDGRQLGLDITAFIGISMNYPKGIRNFLDELARLEEVQECHHVTGGHSLLLKVKTQNTASLEGLISRLRAVEGVARTETMIVLSTSTERSTVPVAHCAKRETKKSPKRRRPTRKKTDDR